MAVQEIAISLISRSPFQPREVFDQDCIADLAESIRGGSLAHTPVVRPIAPEGHYELVCGERRLEAVKLLGKTTILVDVKEMTDIEAARLLAAENLHRKDFTDWEVSRMISIIQDKGFAKTDVEIGQFLGRPRSVISRLKAFCSFPDALAAIVRQAPGRFGYALASDLRSGGWITRHPDLVAEALNRVVAKTLSQEGVITWLKQKTTPQQGRVLKESTLKVKDLAVRITIYPDTIRISCKGMDPLQIEQDLCQLLETKL